MTASVWFGLSLTFAAGLMAGNCMLPLKFARTWKWENTWLVFSLVSLVLLPWTLAICLVRDLTGVYSALTMRQVVVPFLFGAGWGVAQVLFGISVVRLGLALGYAIIIGLGALLGTLVPLLVEKREVLGTSRGTVVLVGIGLMVVGIAVSGWAGRVREKASGGDSKPRGGGNYPLALALAVLCGLMAPMLNYSFAFSQDIAAEAVRHGTSAANASYAVWPVGLTGGLIPSLAYSLFLLWRNRSWGGFRTFWPDSGFAFAMGVLWMGAMALYGVGAVLLGALGTSLGWGLFQIFMIMTATGAGILTGEWSAAASRAKSLLWTGLALLTIATILIASGNR